MRAALEAASGNPSSIHGPGRRARALVEAARADVAALLGVAPAAIVFTSGGSEANALALSGLGAGPRLCSAVEHDSVLRWVPAAGHLPVTTDGLLDPVTLQQALAAAPGAGPGPGLLSLMAANNETGVLQPVVEAARLAHGAGWRVHCDAVQAPGKVRPLTMAELGVDLLTLSAHKLGGPAGIGALVVAGDLTLAPLIRGGGQERGRRAGTENLLGIAGFGAAARAVAAHGADEAVRLAALRARLEAGLLETHPDAVIHGGSVERLANTTCIGLPDRPADIQLIRLDRAGVALGAGSACSSGKVTPSHVLRAMGLDEAAARRALRFSLGWSTTDDDITRALAVWREVVGARGAGV